MPAIENGESLPPLQPPALLSDLRVVRQEDGRYCAAWNGHRALIQVMSCFPWTAPGTYLSLRDAHDREVALVPSLDDLEPESRGVLAQALRASAFAFRITGVTQVRRAFEIRHWEVTCAEGARKFQTKVDDFPETLLPHGLLITDVAGDVYVVEDWTALDKHSRKELALFVD